MPLQGTDGKFLRFVRDLLLASVNLGRYTQAGRIINYE